MTEYGTALTSLFCAAVLMLPRRQAALAFIAAVLYITQGQSTDVGGINMMAIRFVEIAAAIRVMLRKEIAAVRITAPDILLLLFFLACMAITILRTGALDSYTIGLAVDGVLVYFAFRAFISTPEDFTFFMKGMVMLLVPFAVIMVAEAASGVNLFYLMGGIPENPYYRDGSFRAQGSFRHAITAGSVGATFFPIFTGFLFQKTSRIWAMLGIAASLTIVIASHSSGPLMTTIVAAAAWCCWSIRQHMNWVRRGIVATLIGLHLIMKAPVWFIFDRLSGVIGGDGWHRSNIIDQFINSFGEWWLVGMPFENTRDWAATTMSFGSADITNYYVYTGISGGLISLLVFVSMLVAVFKLVGRGLQNMRKDSSKMAVLEPVLWGVSSAICAHIVNFTAVSYWDQSYVIWYLHLAIAVTLGSYCVIGQHDTMSLNRKSNKTLG